MMNRRGGSSLHAPMGSNRGGGLANRPERANRGFSSMAGEGSRRSIFDNSGWDAGSGNPFERDEPMDWNQMERTRGGGLENAWHGGDWQNAVSSWQDQRPEPAMMGQGVQDWVAQRPEIAEVLQNLRARYMGGRF